jgi:hypothetical protein
MDTSNPVVHAIKDVMYPSIGLMTKESQKLYELVSYPADAVDKGVLHWNIETFKKWWNG